MKLCVHENFFQRICRVTPNREKDTGGGEVRLLTKTSLEYHHYFTTSLCGCGYSQFTMKLLQQSSAFVVQFRTKERRSDEQLAGRVEHVASGKTANFESIHELPELLLMMLSDTDQAAEGGACQH